MTPEGRAFNEAFYLPETLPTAAVAALPEVDQDRIATVLSGRERMAASVRVDPDTVPLHDASAVACMGPGPALPRRRVLLGRAAVVDSHLRWRHARARALGTGTQPW